jgi:ankyrin repeat protein
MAVDLVYHASKGHLTVVQKLLEIGVHPDATGSDGETALFHAALEGHANVVKRLIKYGADPNR